MKTTKLLFAFFAAFILVSCSGEKGKSEKKPEQAQSDYARKDTYFNLPAIDGKTVDLAHYRNRPVLLFFFAEYCPFCQKAAPFIKKISGKYRETGLGVIGIGVEGKDEAQKYAAENRLDFPIAYKGGKTARKYRTRGVPYIYLLDKNHDINQFWAGYDESFNSEITAAIEQVLDGR